VESPGLRERMGDAGRARALELYDEAKVVDRQLLAFHKQCGAPKP